jgi:hypothetical protein
VVEAAPVAAPAVAGLAGVPVLVGVTAPVVLAAPVLAALVLELPAALPPVPAAGRCGSVTSMYEAPLEPGSARTAETAIHFEASSPASPK